MGFIGLGVGIVAVPLIIMIIVWATKGAEGLGFGVPFFAFLVGLVAAGGGVAVSIIAGRPDSVAGFASVVGAGAGVVGGALGYLLWFAVTNNTDQSKRGFRFLAGAVLGLCQIAALGAAFGYVAASVPVPGTTEDIIFKGDILGLNIGLGAGAGLLAGGLALAFIDWLKYTPDVSKVVEWMEDNLGFARDIGAAMIAAILLGAVAYAPYLGLANTLKPD